MKNKIFRKVFIYSTLVLHIGLQAGEGWSWRTPSWSGLTTSAYNAYNAATVENMTNVIQRWTTKKTVGAFVVMASVLASYYNFDQILDLLASRIPFPAGFKAGWWADRSYRELVEPKYQEIKNQIKQVDWEDLDGPKSDSAINKKMAEIKRIICRLFYENLNRLMMEHQDRDYSVFKEDYALDFLNDVLDTLIVNFTDEGNAVDVTILNKVQREVFPKK